MLMNTKPLLALAIAAVTVVAQNTLAATIVSKGDSSGARVVVTQVDESRKSFSYCATSDTTTCSLIGRPQGYTEAELYERGAELTSDAQSSFRTDLIIGGAGVIGGGIFGATRKLNGLKGDGGDFTVLFRFLRGALGATAGGGIGGVIVVVRRVTEPDYDDANQAVSDGRRAATRKASEPVFQIDQDMQSFVSNLSYALGGIR